MNGERRTFPLAKMSPGIWWATTLLLLLLGGVAVAIGVGAFGFAEELEREDITPALALLFPAFIAAVFAFVWAYYRPSGFEVSELGLTVRWPIRQRLCRREDITSVRQVTRSEIGTPWRLWGAGGLWGLFGLCWSKNIRRFDAFVSRSDGLVLIEFADGRPLLITPADPEQFVQALTGERADLEGGHA